MVDATYQTSLRDEYMLNDNFEEIASAVKINGSTQNITYSADSKYTSSMILSGIKNALDKAVVTGAK